MAIRKVKRKKDLEEVAKINAVEEALVEPEQDGYVHSDGTIELDPPPPDEEPPDPDVAVPSRTLRAGAGAKRVRTRVVGLYAPGKGGKTTACANLDAIWIISDPNTIPTLAAMKKLPPKANVFEVSDVDETVALLGEMIEAGAQGGAKAIGAPVVVLDAITPLHDNHRQNVARRTGQSYLGQRPGVGWREFNSEMGQLLDMLAELGKYVNVVLIFHSKEKFDIKRGELHGLNLSPELAARAGRLVNWLLYLTVEADEIAADDETAPDEYTTIIDVGDGTRQRHRRVIHTVPFNQWPSSVNAQHLNPIEPPDLAYIFKKEGLL